MSLTKTTYSMIRGAVANVLDYGAKGDGVTDDTDAFDAAIATGKKVYVPKTPSGYVVNDITVVNNMVIEGEKPGVSGGVTPTLIVTQNNSGAFAVARDAFQIEIRNFTIAAAPGVTGARAYKQIDKTYYSAYVRFVGIETSSNLAISYDLFPIFTVWQDCRDAYIDAALAQGHQAINAIPADWFQGNQCNINRIVDSSFWGANGTNCRGSNNYEALVDIAYGETWSIQNTDFEAANIPAFRARGVYNCQFQNTRFERAGDTRCVISAITPSNPIGSSLSFTNCIGFLSNLPSGGYFAETGAASTVQLTDCLFAQIPTGVVLANSASGVRNAFNIGAIGAGSAGFLTGFSTSSYSAGKLLFNAASPTGSPANIQNTGTLQSTTGFLSVNSLNITTVAQPIATPVNIGALCFVNGFNLSGGATGWWLVACNNTTATVIASNNLTGLTVSFTVVAGVLNMATTSGSIRVNTSVLL